MMNKSSSYRRIAGGLLKEYSPAVRSSAVSDDRTVRRSVWLDSDRAIYINRDTSKMYQPHNSDEAAFISSDAPRRWLLKGGEGSGKSVSGIIKDLERLRRGMSGIMGSPDFVHFRKSLWPEFRRWCPVNALIPKHRYRLEPDWAPTQPFELVFKNGATLLCGGFDRPGSWEGPNVSFAHFDEARHHPSSAMVKVLDGRCRIAGPHGEPPQWWLTTTPRKSRLSSSPDDDQYHWLYVMFGPWTDKTKEDPFADFKSSSRVITLRLEENAANLADEYVANRKQSLTNIESEILIDAEWSDEESLERFLPTMSWWDSCKEIIPPPSSREPMVIALDAATGRMTSSSDSFGLVAVTRHPQRHDHVAIRESKEWHASAGHKIDFIGDDISPGPETIIKKMVKDFNVVCIVYDQHQLVSTAQRLEVECKVWFESFGQVSKRLLSDRAFLDRIIRKEVSHDGDDTLRNHIDNADRKVDDFGSKFRIVKGRGRVDLAVCSSMAVWQCMELVI